MKLDKMRGRHIYQEVRWLWIGTIQNHPRGNSGYGKLFPVWTKEIAHLIVNGGSYEKVCEKDFVFGIGVVNALSRSHPFLSL